jgi:hypothetical protein
MRPGAQLCFDEQAETPGMHADLLAQTADLRAGLGRGEEPDRDFGSAGAQMTDSAAARARFYAEHKRDPGFALPEIPEQSAECRSRAPASFFLILRESGRYA